MVNKPPSYLIMIWILPKNRVNDDCMLLITYRTYCCICLGENMQISYKKTKFWPFWRHFDLSWKKSNRFYDVQSMVMTTKYVFGEHLQKSMCKTDLFGEYPNFTLISPFFGHFWARKIQMSKYLRLFPSSMTNVRFRWKMLVYQCILSR